MGRFLQTDPVGYDDDLNLYQYAYNDPLNVTDPTGMDGACTYTADACGMKTTDPARVAAQVNAGKGMTVAVAAVAVAAMVEVAGPAVAGKVVESAAKQGSAEGAAGGAESAAGRGVAGNAAGGLKLQKQLASESQMSQLSGGGGKVVSQPAKQAERIAAQSGSNPSNIQKLSSNAFVAKDGQQIQTHAFRNSSTNELIEPKAIINE